MHLSAFIHPTLHTLRPTCFYFPPLWECKPSLLYACVLLNIRNGNFFYFFAPSFFLLCVQVITSNGLCFYCLVVGKCFVCQDGLQCLCAQGRKGGGKVPLFNPSHQSHSTSLSYRTIQRLCRLKLALLSACHWLAVFGSLVKKPIVWVNALLLTLSSSRDAHSALKEPSPFTFSLFYTFQLAVESMILTFSIITLTAQF